MSDETYERGMKIRREMFGPQGAEDKLAQVLGSSNPPWPSES